MTGRAFLPSAALFAALAGGSTIAGPVAARSRPPVTKPAATMAVPPASIPPAVPPQLAGMQYLYGSAEAAALTRQVWRNLADYVDRQLADNVHQGVVLASGSTLTNLQFVPCGDKPPAVVFDVDETVLLNLGAEYDDLVSGRPTFSADIWARWEKTGARFVAPAPGAKEALDRLRGHGVTVIFNTNRSVAFAAEAQAALEAAGLGPARHGETLFLSGDDATGSHKDVRRQVIAARHCVLAMGGDQLGDFSDLFNSEPTGVAARRDTTAYSGIAALWGNGWFVLPNPVYGSALKGGPEEIFPQDKKWRDPGPSNGPSSGPSSGSSIAPPVPNRAPAHAKEKN